MFLLNFIFKILIILPLNPLDLSAQLKSLQSAIEYAARFVNAKGIVLVVRLYDILNRVREVALHGVHHGAAMALAAAQARFGFFPMVFQPPNTLGIMSAWSRISLALPAL